jgi:hypothetical protein
MPLTFTRRVLLLALAGGSAALWAQATVPSAVPSEVAAEMPGAQWRGSGRLSFLGLAIYEARLWVGEGFKAEAYEQAPLAIELEYARTLYGTLIAERSLTEMKRVGGIDDAQAESWLASLKKIIPDVAKGDRITGVFRPGESARFFLNGKALGEVRDAEFARRFFGIWLSPKTSEPKLRLALLGPVAGASRATP